MKWVILMLCDSCEDYIGTYDDYDYAVEYAAYREKKFGIKHVVRQA